jgi:hypothetical protein
LSSDVAKLILTLKKTGEKNETNNENNFRAFGVDGLDERMQRVLQLEW